MSTDVLIGGTSPKTFVSVQHFFQGFSGVKLVGQLGGTGTADDMLECFFSRGVYSPAA